MPRVLLPYPPIDRDQLWWAVKALFGVSIPRTKVCPDHCAPFDAFADAYFRECTLPGYEGPVSRAIWHASRGLAGKSYTLATLGLFFAYVIGADITILGGSLSQSNNVHDYMNKTMEFEGIPTSMTIDQTATKTKLTNQGRIRPLPASQRNVRGPHPSILLIDEADEMDLDIYDAALGQPLPQDNYLGQTVDTFTVVSSTWQNPDGAFTEILRRAEEKHQPKYSWCTAAGSMVTTRRGPVAIEAVRLDDQVLTRAGWRAVQHVTFMGHKQTLTFRTASGHTLTCTPDHLVAVSGGWLPAGALREGDRLAVIGALPAVAAPVRSLVEIGTAVGMSSRTVGLGQLMPDDFTALNVDSQGHHLEVVEVGVAAGVDLTEMVHGQAGRNVNTSQAHGQSMSQLLLPRIGGATNFPVSPGVATECPDPTTVVVDNGTFPDVVEVHVESVVPGAIAPVWDIGVEGEHEFVANGIVVHNCYKESSNPVDGWLTQKTIDEKRDSVSAEMFRVEYDLGEPSIGNRAFDAEAIERTFCRKFAPADVVGDGDGYVEHKELKDFEEYRFARRVDGGQYVAGADWAKEQDKTVVWVARIDGEQRELVYFLRVNRRPYPLMIGYLNAAITYYRVPLKGVWHDSTGLGNVVNDYLDIRARPFPMTGDKRAVLLSDYVNAIEKGTWRIPRIPSAWLEHKYCAKVGSLVWTVRGQVPIEQVQVGDLAMTRAGFRRVTAVLDNGVRPTSRLRTRDGKEVFLTGDHEVASGRSWVRVDALEIGDVLDVGLADPAVTASRGVDAGVLVGVRMPVGAMSGSPVGIGESVTTADVLGLGDRFKVRRVAARPAGAASFYDMVDDETVRDWADEYLVGQAMGQTTLGFPVAEAVDVQVPDPAVTDDRDPVEDVLPVGIDFLGMSRAVRAAYGPEFLGGYSAVGTDHVAEVTPAGEARVFDLTIEGEHEFFANGICVHNCSTGDLYSGGQKKEFHLPDTVCAAALAEYAAKRFTGTGAPVVVKRSSDPTALDQQFTGKEETVKSATSPLPSKAFNLVVD